MDDIVDIVEHTSVMAVDVMSETQGQRVKQAIIIAKVLAAVVDVGMSFLAQQNAGQDGDGAEHGRTPDRVRGRELRRVEAGATPSLWQQRQQWQQD